MSKDTSPSADPAQRPLWRHPIWLLVIGGPLTVVVASIVTAVIAARGQDPVLDTRVRVQAADDASAAGAAKERAEMPALAARNHAVSPNPAQAAGGSK